MKRSDRHHQWVEWSDEDQADLGRCPDLITGIHGDDPIRLDAELCEIIEEVLAHLEAEGRPLPELRVRPMREVG